MKLNKIQIVLIKKETSFAGFFCLQSFQYNLTKTTSTSIITIEVDMDNLRFPDVVLSSKPQMGQFHVVGLQRTKRDCSKGRAVRTARLFLLVQPIKFLICGDVVSVPEVSA